MIKDFETKFTGWAFIVAALLLWGGWALSPHHVGEYFVASDLPPLARMFGSGSGCIDFIFLAG